MSPISQPRRPLYFLALPLLFVMLVVCMSPMSVQAAERNTLFLPFKINAPDSGAIVGPADRSLEREAAARGMKMIPRSQAEKLVDYQGAWPPSAAALNKVADTAGADYVVVGSLNKLGNRISVDCVIVDVLAPKAPYSAFREADSFEDLDRVTGEIVNAMLAYSNRSAAIASVVPEGNERIDSGAILQKISTKPGDLYDPVTLRQDIKAVFGMGYFENVEVDAQDTEAGKHIIFRVQEKPLIGKVVINGTDAITEEDVQEAANIS
ncbi:MAG: outer membrane protein assembly factor BamA, partial [Desulfobulbus sp.]|nr:outer membrane protein assembly factor BamA [Desulfobulbus sp.]